MYYFNTKEIGDNLYGTATPIPFLVIINETLGYKMSVDIRCNGDYSYRITDPMLFYKNVCGNVSSYYDRSEIDGRLKGELLTALQPALGKLAAQRIEYFEIPAHTLEIADALNEILSKQWREKRGIEIVSFNIRSLSIPDEQRRKLTEWEETAMTTNPNTAAARIVGGQIDAMKTAAGNAGGAAVGFMGMNMAQGAVGTDAQSLFAMSAHQTAAPAADSWRCACGNTATGKFCTECGAKRPETNTADGWVCSCGAVNKGKFCSECGAKKPADAYTYRCDKCGWEPADPAHPPKFCPECGDAFDENDRT